MARCDLPTGLSGAWSALTMHGDNKAHDRLISLVWARLLTDPTAPMTGGHDSRTVLDVELPWAETAWDAETLDVFGARMNWNMGAYELLSTDWHELSELTVGRAVQEVRRWQPIQEIGDQLGYVSQRITSESTKSARGAFYTPYSVSLLMARMTGPEPGASVLDCCCGSGSMLLAALEACRDKHGPTKVPEVYGIDIDPRAVRLCRLNLALAGVHPAHRIECRDALIMTPPEQLSPTQRAMQLALFDYEAGVQVGLRRLDPAA